MLSNRYVALRLDATNNCAELSVASLSFPSLHGDGWVRVGGCRSESLPGRRLYVEWPVVVTRQLPGLLCQADLRRLQALFDGRSVLGGVYLGGGLGVSYKLGEQPRVILLVVCVTPW
jgi:hypothetical protein